MAKSTATLAPEVPEEPQINVAISTGGAANQQTLRNISLVIEHEYKNRVKQRSFIISTIILLVLIAFAACIPTLLQLLTGKGGSQTHLTVVNTAGSIAGLSDAQLTPYISSVLNGPSTSAHASTSSPPPYIIQTATADQVNNLRQRVKSGELSILLVFDRASNQDLHITYYTNVNATDDPHLSQVQGLADQLGLLDKATRFHLTPQQANSLFIQPGFTFVNTQPGARSSSDQWAGYLIAYAGVLLIFMSVVLYGIGVANGVAEEKGSHIIEILVNAATPFQLMIGKIIGIGAAGLTQMVALVAVGIGALLLQGPLQNALLGTTTNSGLGINITSFSINLLLLVLVYFLLGFLLYATLFAALGALVKRQDEVQNAVQPLQWLFMIGYLASALGGATNTDTAWMKGMSFIPFWTPAVMPMRIAAGNASWWEVLVSILLMIVFIFLCAVFSARIYRFAILMYGQRSGLKQLLRIGWAN